MDVSPILSWGALSSLGDQWIVAARSEYEAGIRLRSYFRREGREMPSDLVWVVLDDS
jgi:hypothetical protein